MTFNDSAVRVVSDSVRTAYAVDNEILEPFTEEGSSALSKGIYDSFMAAGCSLQLARFTDFENWEKNQKLHLKTKDLLILDWELNETGVKYASALEILFQALNEPCLPFVCIYTHTKELDDIVFNILSYVWERSLTQSNFSKVRNEFIEHLENELEDFGEEKLQDIAQKSLEIFISPHRRKEIKKEIAKDIDSSFGKKGCETFVQIGEKLFCTNRLDEILATFVLSGEQYAKKKDDQVGFPIIPINQGESTFSYLVSIRKALF